MDSLEIYEILVREHERMLLAYVLSLVAEPALAEEVVQETFVRAYRRIAALRKTEAFGSWIRTIARNLVYAEFRHRAREVPTDPQIIAGMEDVFGALDRTENGEAWEQRAQALRVCYDHLPDTLRHCCRLFYMEDCPTKDCARTLNISLAAVLKRLERARDALARCVEKRLTLEPA